MCALQEGLQFNETGAVGPPTIGPVVAFQDQTNIIQTQALELSNVGNVTYRFQVTPAHALFDAGNRSAVEQ